MDFSVTFFSALWMEIPESWKRSFAIFYAHNAKNQKKTAFFFFSSFFFNSSRPIANLFENCIFYTPKLTIYDFWIFKVPIFAHFQAILIFETPKKTQKFEFYGQPRTSELWFLATTIGRLSYHLLFLVVQNCKKIVCNQS